MSHGTLQVEVRTGLERGVEFVAVRDHRDHAEHKSTNATCDEAVAGAVKGALVVGAAVGLVRVEGILFASFGGILFVGSRNGAPQKWQL